MQIADFGLLRYASTCNTETVNIKGTPQFMAPEAVRGDVSIKIDVWSYGVLMLEVATGLRGMVDGTQSDLVRQKIDYVVVGWY